MGYGLHITRKERWSNDAGPTVDEAEWRRIIDEDPELSPDLETRCVMSDGEFVFAAWKGDPGVLGWYHGEIVATNPDELLIGKMVQIARKLGASVQGDDGEIYQEDGSSFQPGATAPPPPGPGLLKRTASWFRSRWTTRRSQRAGPAFHAGDRVRDSWGGLGTVVEVDRRANRGLGSVRVRFDDGRELTFAYVASGLEIVGKPAGSR